ncbi:MAG: hypothetical protein A3H93_10440 [Rhodocyclales bacterium RIFCSPLOWO2_02_FULL_63_24]|nr:MAG: hypothetical protein A3H93_10440 [Rhodocyclales bacterium RIFCSPLOWO2_02_FULL_63_24]
MEKAPRFSTEYLDQLIAEATTDAYNESEQAVGFFTMIEENLAVPFVTQVLGQDVNVVSIDITVRDEIVALCTRDKKKQSIPILDLPMPNSLPSGAEWIEAYRRWYGA